MSLQAGWFQASALFTECRYNNYQCNPEVTRGREMRPTRGKHCGRASRGRWDQLCTHFGQKYRKTNSGMSSVLDMSFYKTRLQGGQLWGKGCFVNIKKQTVPLPGGLRRVTL